MARKTISTAEILAQLPAADAREQRELKAGKRAMSARYDRSSGRIMMELSNGAIFGIPARSIPSLAQATATQLAAVEVGPGGSGLRWDDLDVDLSVPGLLMSVIGRSQKLSELARLAGRTKSLAKSAAARTNGAKGGRPRKTARK